MESAQLTLERMTDKDVDEFLALEKRVSVTKIYNPIVTVDEALEEIRDNELFFIKKVKCRWKLIIITVLPIFTEAMPIITQEIGK